MGSLIATPSACRPTFHIFHSRSPVACFSRTHIAHPATQHPLLNAARQCSGSSLHCRRSSIAAAAASDSPTAAPAADSINENDSEAPAATTTSQGGNPLAATLTVTESEAFWGRMQALLRQVASFGLPALLVPLADPLMSLIDTVALGQLASSMQLAALGPCSLLFNFCFYSFSALSVATVSLIAERLAWAEGGEQSAAQILTTALCIGAIGGVAISALLLFRGPQLLKMTGCDPALLPISWEYLQIRALAAPAAITTQVAQSGLLGQRNSRTPYKIVLASVALSLLGDVVLIGGLGLGVAGAAWSTVAAQFTSAGLLLLSLQKSRVVPSLKGMASTGADALKALLQTASALGVFYVAKTSSYLFLQATATKLPVLLLAAHQPVWQIWGLTSFTNTPLEQAALAFIPSARTHRDRRELILLLVSIGATFGFICALVAHGVPAVAPGLLTADPRLWPIMQSKAVWVPGALALIACGMDVSSTGVLLACKDTAYVARSMIISFAALAMFLWRNSNGYGEAIFEGLGGVWWALAVFFGARVVQSLPRVLVHLRPYSEEEDETMKTAAAAGHAKAA